MTLSPNMSHQDLIQKLSTGIASETEYSRGPGYRGTVTRVSPGVLERHPTFLEDVRQQAEQWLGRDYFEVSIDAPNRQIISQERQHPLFYRSFPAKFDIDERHLDGEPVKPTWPEF